MIKFYTLYSSNYVYQVGLDIFVKKKSLQRVFDNLSTFK